MEQANYLLLLDFNVAVLFPVAFLLLAWVIPFLADRYGLTRYPGPLLAKFSTLWLSSKAYKGTTSTTVHALHQKYGAFCCK